MENDLNVFVTKLETFLSRHECSMPIRTHERLKEVMPYLRRYASCLTSDHLIDESRKKLIRQSLEIVDQEKLFSRPNLVVEGVVDEICGGCRNEG